MTSSASSLYLIYTIPNSACPEQIEAAIDIRTCPNKRGHPQHVSIPQEGIKQEGTAYTTDYYYTRAIPCLSTLEVVLRVCLPILKAFQESVRHVGPQAHFFVMVCPANHPRDVPLQRMIKNPRPL
jgi:hypothetical protein